MGNTQSTQKINFEDMQFALQHSESYILINTLNLSEQDFLIPNSISASHEEKFINQLIKNGKKDIKIIIYGKNSNDDNIYKKQIQLKNLGFFNVYVYPGGLFEWVLLQDIYSENEFPTTKKELDILKFKPNKVLNVSLLEY